MDPLTVSTHVYLRGVLPSHRHPLLHSLRAAHGDAAASPGGSFPFPPAWWASIRGGLSMIQHRGGHVLRRHSPAPRRPTRRPSAASSFRPWKRRGTGRTWPPAWWAPRAPSGSSFPRAYHDHSGNHRKHFHRRLFLGGVFPGILMGLALMVTSGIFARKRNLPAEPKATWGERWHAFTDSILALMTMVIIMGGILSASSRPREASVVAAFYSSWWGGSSTANSSGKTYLQLWSNRHHHRRGGPVHRHASSFGWILARSRFRTRLRRRSSPCGQPGWSSSPHERPHALHGHLPRHFAHHHHSRAILFPIARQLGVTPITSAS